MSERLPDIVSVKENIARYLLEGRKFTASTGNIKHHAFMPSPKTLQTSVYRTDGCDESQVWGIGQGFVGNPQDKSVLARADVIAGDIINVGLDINPDVSPHLRHANIEGWPAEKSAQIMKAKQIRNKATLIVNPNI